MYGSRLSILSDGRIAYLLRKPRRNGATHLVMTSAQFLARISALIPPPRYPLLRLHGVFAPRSSWRAAVVPSGPGARPGAPTTTRRVGKTKKKPRTATKEEAAASPFVSSAEGTSTERGRDGENAAPNGPRTSLGDGLVKPGCGRIAWAQLLRRISLVDGLACPCGGRRAIVADISDREVIVAILAHLALPTEAPPIARARSPAFDVA
jgi:putative transposase